MNARRLIPLALLALLAQGAAAEEADWSFELKAGRLQSAADQWSDYYGDDRLSMVAIGIGYKLRPQIELGVEAGYLSDSGEGFAPGHGTLTGKVDYRLYPIHLQLTLRGILHSEQWLVPYVGAGWSRLNYRVATEGQSTVSGGTDGYQYRAGLQLLLDNLDPGAAGRFATDFGIASTYFFLEAQRVEAELEGIELGGDAYLAGIRFDF